MFIISQAVVDINDTYRNGSIEYSHLYFGFDPNIGTVLDQIRYENGERMSRIILKLSGEALAGEKGNGFDLDVVKVVAGEVKHLLSTGDEIGIVIGGGNFWRGRTGTEIDRVKSDQIGMLATVMNCIYVSEVFRSEGMKTQIFTPFGIEGFTTIFDKDTVVKAMKKGRVVFFAGGTGHPYFSTDTGVVLHAIKVDADVILMAKNIDGIYNADPAKDPTAKRYDVLPIQRIIDENLQAIDMTASILARDNKMPMRIFDLNEENSIVKAASGEFNGTTVTV